MKRTLHLLPLVIASLIVTASHAQTNEPEGKLILFDTSHGEKYLPSTEYSLLSFELRQLGYIVREGEIKDLSGIDLLVISTPTKPFSEREIDQIVKFVKDGGSILVIAGVADYLNPLANRFGVHFNKDIVIDKSDNDGDPQSPIIHRFSMHPITRGLTSFSMYWGGSLGLLKGEMAIAWGDQDSISIMMVREGDKIVLKQENTVYGFGEYPPVLAAFEFGDGRCVFMSDSSTLKDFYLNKFDNKELGIRIFKWLLHDLSQVGEEINIGDLFKISSYSKAPDTVKGGENISTDVKIYVQPIPIKSNVYLRTDLKKSEWIVSLGPELGTLHSSGREFQFELEQDKLDTMEVRVVGECPKIPGEFDVINIEVEIPLIHGFERRILFRETSEVVPEGKTIKNIENDESGVHKYLWYFFVLPPLLGIYIMIKRLRKNRSTTKK